MKKISFELSPLFKGVAVAMLSVAVLSGCNGSSENDQDNLDTGLPEGLTLAMVDANAPEYVAYDTYTGDVVDLNEEAINSGDSAVQKLQISDTSTIGYFFHWPDFRVINEGTDSEEEKTDMKYLLMKPDYVSGSEITHEDFVQLVHFHGEGLAAHSADEFNPESLGDNWLGSGKQLGLARLNKYVQEQADLEEELAGALPEGQTLCRAFVDPYIKFESEHEEEEASAAEGDEHEHGELVHIALTNTGRIYFYQEHEEQDSVADDAGLELSQEGYVALSGVTSIENCHRTTIARASDHGILVFVADAQKLYLVDSHGGDWHEHSYWDVADFVPEGNSVDLMAALGEGSEYEEHDDEDDDHDH